MIKPRFRYDYDCPPIPYLKQVLSHIPKAGMTYIWLWEHSNDNKVCQLRSSKIAETTLMSKATFKHDLRALCREGLLSFQEHEDIMEIELVDWDDDEDDEDE